MESLAAGVVTRKSHPSCSRALEGHDSSLKQGVCVCVCVCVWGGVDGRREKEEGLKAGPCWDKEEKNFQHAID